MIHHLLELRRRMLRITVVFVSFFIIFFAIAPQLFHAFVSPLLRALPLSEGLIATQITAPLLIPIRIAADVALLATTPFILLQVWHFIAPGLYHSERQPLRWVIISSLFLFASGVIFCFYVILPVILQFFVKATPLGVRFMPDITYAVDFMTRMLLLFGLCFQVPLICVVLVYTKFLTVAHLRQGRSYVIVSAFILGMLLTPDIFSQITFAVPMCLLYELGIQIARRITFKTEDSLASQCSKDSKVL